MKSQVKLSDYAKLKGCSVRTLWRRISEGKLKVIYSDTGRVYVPLEESKNEYVVVYARVSSSDTKDNLDRQAERLVQFCNAKGWQVKEVVKEVGSGLNDERKKLISLLQNKEVSRIVIEHKDRLTRFGFNYIQTLSNAEIYVVSDVITDEQDLMQDFVSLVTSFCARIYGKKRSKIVTEKLIRELSTEEQCI
nr:MAG TPA: hypothetical protein [Caudoviricetes sp.]